MKSKHLLLLLLFAMFAPWAANAQNRTIITIGEGTSTNYYPMPGFYGYQYDVYLYTPGASEELNANNCTISSIAYYLTSISATSGAKMEIWLKDVAAEYVLDNAMTFSQYIDGATKVVDDDEFTTTETGWKTMSFTEDFVHEAGMGLLVAVRGVGCSGTGGCSRYCRYTTADYMHWYKRADNNDPGQNATGTLDANRSNIQLDITESAGVTCPKPTNLTVSYIDSNMATINWESTGNDFAFQFKKATDEEWNGPYDTPNQWFTMAELDPNTTYVFRVKNICSRTPLEESTYATTQFTTACGSIASFPWTEGFESYEANTIPSCWDNSASTTSTLSSYPERIWGVYSYSDNKMLRMYNYYVQSGTALINTNPIALPEEEVYQLAFDYSHRASCGAFKVKISTDGGTTFTDLQSYTSTGSNETTNPGTFTTAEPIYLTAYAGQTVILQFYADANYGSGSIFLDNVSISEAPTCLPSTGLHVEEGSITSTGASFIWDAEEGASFEYFTISDPWEGFEPAVDQSWTSTQNNTVGWPNAFSPNEVVRFYLRKDCGNDGYSDYTYVEFRTLCGPTSLINGYAEDFNDDTYTPVSTSTTTPSGYPNVALPYCWQFLNLSESTSTYPQAFLTSSSTYAVSGNCLFFKSSNTTPLYAILPEFEENISENQLTFTYRNEGVSDYNGILYVGYLTDPSDASTFVQTLACGQTTTLTEKTAYFANAPQGSFMAFKYEGGTDNNYYLSIDDVVVSQGPSCFPTGTLDCVELSSTTATLSWTLVDAQQNAWVVEYSESNQFFAPVVSVDASQNWNFVIEGLEPETQYYARVRGNCGDGSLSDVSNTITFTTLDACPLPTDLVASNLTQNTADLSWTGSVDVESYMVWYRTAEQVVGIDEQFNSSTPSGWEVKTGLLSDVMGGAALNASSSPYWTFGTNNGVFDSHARLNVWGANCKSWLITPSHTVESGDVFTFDLALTAYSGNNVPSPATTGTDDRFVVLVTNDGGETWTILREWNNSGSDYVYNDIANSATGEQVSLNLNDYVGQSVRIAFYGESTTSNADNNLHIDNVRIGTHYAPGGDNFVQCSSTTLQLTDLIADRIYDVQVRSICNNDTWTDIYNFKTLDQNTKVFIGGQALDGYDVEEVGDKWWNPNNWVPYGMPSALNDSPKDDVILRHDAVISINLITGRNIIADANSITFEGTPKPTLTLEDGNQLRLNTNISEQNQVTVKKNITGYTMGAKDYYYLISIPAHKVGQLTPVNAGLVTTESDYDLYAFDPAASDGLEWRNYKAETFYLDQAEGYLYANAADVELHFTGEIRRNSENYTIFNLNYEANGETEFNGWELMGNPLTCNAYLSTNSQTMAFYRMNADGTEFEVATGAIKPMEGFFSQNTVNGESVVLSRVAPSKGMSRLNLVLSQGRDTKDNAIIRFDEGNTLEKLNFRENSSRVYIPQEGKDYVVVCASDMGEMPVSFKAESNGSYTLSFTNEDVSFSYLHLIDNLTGNEVDLLENPSYTFEAKTTDYASRFKLVFATGSSTSSNNFAFYSNGNWVISNEGNATLQVVDVTGRILKSESINGCANVNFNAAPGVYMLRLVNGDNVKVQKVVVR